VSLWFPNRPQSSPLARQSLSSLQGGGGGGGLVAHQQPSNKQRPRAMPMPVPTPHAVAQSSRRHTPWHRAPGVTRRGTELQASHAVAQSSRRRQRRRLCVCCRKRLCGCSQKRHSHKKCFFPLAAWLLQLRLRPMDGRLRGCHGCCGRRSGFHLGKRGCCDWHRRGRAAVATVATSSRLL